MPEYRYRINSTAGKAGDKVTQTGNHLRQLEQRNIVYEVKPAKPAETKQAEPKQDKPKASKKGAKK